MTDDSATGRHSPEIEITPEMIKAGRRAYHDCDTQIFDTDSMIEVVFEAMINARKDSSSDP